MILQNILSLLVVSVLGAQAPMPRCEPEPGRRAEQIRGEVTRGNEFSQPTAGGWILRLAPDSEGWFLQVTMKGREMEDLSRLTPPWHFVPNPREIEGWHFRNADNTAPNDGSVNAPQELRDFIFHPKSVKALSTTAVRQLRRMSRGFDRSDAAGSSSSRTGSRHHAKASAPRLSR